MFNLSRLLVPVVAGALVIGAVGCENQHPLNIPATAMIATSGNGTVTSTALHDGSVYVYDVNADRLDYSGPVVRGDTVTVNTDNNEILINSQVKATKMLNTGNKHRIYFDLNPVLTRHAME
ncbi:MAG: hypothetical protein JO353_03060 [Phycisphaerae bacterium]|nr:hypothetical protein [Phycisphaerae bacterium]